MIDVNELVSKCCTNNEEYFGYSPIGIYQEIIKIIDNKDKLSEDEELIKYVGKFFAMQMRGVGFVRECLNIIEEIKKNEVVFENDNIALCYVQSRLYKFRYFDEISFSSKVLHLADPKHEFIIYDQLVKKSLNIPVWHKSYVELTSLFCKFEHSINVEVNDFSDCSIIECKQFIERLDDILGEDKINISNRKKIDFYLWGIKKFK